MPRGRGGGGGGGQNFFFFFGFGGALNLPGVFQTFSYTLNNSHSYAAPNKAAKKRNKKT